MISDFTRPATMADVQFLAELVTKNSMAIDELKEDMNEGFDNIYEKFNDIEKLIRSIGKHLGNHEDRIGTCKQRILALEVAA